MMRSIKNSTNDFICAKRSVQPFNVKSSGEDIETTASYLLMVYDQHIALNLKMLNIVKNLGNLNQADFVVKMADQMSTLQVERDQRWADLVPAVSLTLGMLVDVRPTDDDGNFIPATEVNLKQGKTKRFAITKAQKQALLDWTAERFPSSRTKLPRISGHLPRAPHAATSTFSTMVASARTSDGRFDVSCGGWPISRVFCEK